MQGKLEVGEHQFDVETHRENETILVSLNGKEYAVKLEETEQGFTVMLGGNELHVEVTDEQKDHLRLSRSTDVSVDGHLVSTLFRPQRSNNLQASVDEGDMDEGSVTALMPGTIMRILVEEGQTVASGDVLLILEAMKMENEIKAPLSGVVESIAVEEGKPVNKGELLVHIEAENGEAVEGEEG
ncbi:MAG: biotin/lipoyl-binding protein [Deltaproteobacteria bacterium]|nr:MAG: biotin/lipoyl-binding protein [Deltaproteobacteria bacterium]